MSGETIIVRDRCPACGQPADVELYALALTAAGNNLATHVLHVDHVEPSTCPGR